MKKKHRTEHAGPDHSDEIKRLNRIVGQVEGVRKMLEEQRRLGDILIQCKAIRSALRAIESRIVRSHIEAALDDIVKLDKKKSREEKVAELEELFEQVS